MTTSGNHFRLQNDPLIDAYLDDSMEPADCARFEASLASSPQLREQIELQGRIDDSLTRLFGPVPAAGATNVPARSVRPWIIALAAAVLLASAAVWIVAGLVMGPQPVNRLGPIYHYTLASGFEPEIVCTTPAEFADWVRTNYGQALYPGDDPGVEYVGWSYGPVVSGYSGILLARVDGEPVIVVMDRREREYTRQAHPEDPGLSMHRRRIGELVLYEVTPHGRARILPLLRR
jgi:hypothetical protein